MARMPVDFKIQMVEEGMILLILLVNGLLLTHRWDFSKQTL